jgi:HEAT repeat protein/cyclophilin family peptidyl-prolyl cis-trans isomerase
MNTKLVRYLTGYAAVALALSISPARGASSRYAPLLSTTSGQDTLKNIALWEEQRVTGDGKLFEYLLEGTPLVRVRVLEAIGRIQDPSDAAKVIPWLGDRRPEVRREAVFTLGQLGNRDAVAPLVKARAAAVPADLPHFAEALGKIGGEDAIACLTDLLRDFNAGPRAEAALALARCKDPTAANALLLAVHDPDAGVAWRAIYALEKQDALPRTCDTVAEFLESKDPMVRAYAARTLGKLACAGATKALIAALKDDDIRVVVNAARALGEIKSHDAIQPLGNLLMTHASQHARAQAAMALEGIGHKNARDALMQGLLDRSAMVRIHSIRAMAVSLGTNSEMYCDQMRRDGERLVRAEAIACYGRAGITNRIKELEKIAHSDNDPMMRAAAVGALGKLKDESVPPLLVPALRDPDFTVATAAAEAIGAQAFHDAAPVLMEAYDAHDEREFVDLKLEVIRVLGEMGVKAADSLLFHATSHEDPRVRTAAVEAITKLGLQPPPIPTDRQFHEAAFDRSRRKALAPPRGMVRALITTKRGNIDVELFGDDAIQTVATFVKLAKEGFYKGRTFHRVVPNFVVQGGDPRGDGSGDAGFTIPAEVSHHRYAEGVLGIADAGKDTGSCQWFITLSPQPHLDGRYTVFGRVTNGMDVVWKLDVSDTFDVKIIE